MKKLYILVLTVLFGVNAFAQQPTVSWITNFGGSSVDGDYVYSSCSDPSGNVYVAGIFNGTVDFDPGSGTAFRTSVGTDAYISKFNSAGIFQWVIAIQGAGSEAVGAITADANAIYATGYFSGSTDFDGTSGTVTRISAGGSADIFIAKYNTSAGGLLFVNSFGSSDPDLGTTIALDASSNIYVGGAFTGSVDFDPSTAFATLTSNTNSDYDMFLAKYNTNGLYNWVVGIGSNGEDVPNVVATDGSSVFIGGYYDGDFLHADPNDNSVGLDNEGDYDGYFGRYSASNGALLWGGYVQSTGSDQINSIALTESYVYVAGAYTGNASLFGDNGTTITLDQIGAQDGFVAQFSKSTMQRNWSNVIGNSGNDYVNAIAADGGSVYVTGAYSGTLDLDPSPGLTSNVTAVNDFDGYYAKYNHISGALAATPGSIGGSGTDQGVTLALNNGNLYWAGDFTGTADLSPFSSVDQRTGASATAYDVFLEKLSPVEPANSIPGSIIFGSIGATTFNYAFTPSSSYPDGYITIARIGGAPTTAPVDGVGYNIGDVIGNGFVMANGPYVSYGVTGATPSSTYNIAVYPYNGSGSSANYKSTPLSGTVTTGALATQPSSPPAALSFSNVLATSYTVNFNAAIPLAGGYIVIRGEQNHTSIPADGNVYNVGDPFGNETVAFIGGFNAAAGSAITFNETNMKPGTLYYYRVYSYNGTTGNINYLTSSFASGTVLTISVAAEPANQPTNLVFSNVTQTGFDFNFTASTSTVTGYLGIRATGAAVTFVPTDGVVYNQGVVDATNNQIIAFNDIGTSWFYDVQLTPNTDYHFAIFAYNGSGTNINYKQVNPLRGNQKTLSNDFTAPSIDDNTVTKTAGNTDITITANITDDGTGVSVAHVQFRPIATGGDFEYIEMTNTTGNTWVATIEAKYNTLQGVQYRIGAVDNNENGDVTPWTAVVVEYTESQLSIPYSAGTDQKNYRIIAVPLILNTKTVAAVFGDDLGDYDKKKYRLFRYNGSSNSELSSSSTILPGQGYWFIAAESKTIDAGVGTTVDATIDNPFYINITQGWNQIGNPYMKDIAWSLVEEHIENSDVTMGKLKTYESGWQDNASTLKKNYGGFINIQDVGDGKLHIPLHEGDTDSDRKAAPVNFQQSIASDTWAVDLNLKSGLITNTFGGFGMHPTAKEHNDKYDDFTLPRFIDYLELNSNKKFVGSPFTKDIVPTATQHMWEFEVESNLSEDIIEITWDNSFFGSTNQQLVLWDVAQQRAIDMKSEKSYTFSKSQSRNFKVFYGDAAYVKTETLPHNVVFHSISPVPSSGNVTFEFSLPESSAGTRTNLTIYSLTGQKVANLIDSSLPEGYHKAVWNIEDGVKPASGLYISVLTTGDTTLQKRLIIK